MKLAKILLFLLILVLSAGIFKVTIDYLNPHFDSGFLKGKQAFFSQIVFKASLFTHGFSASICVIFLTILVLFRIDRKYLSTHRKIGKLALLMTVFVVFPSGLILSFYADGGKIGRILFLFLSIAMCYAAINGWRSIRKKQVMAHKTWMQFLLLLFCSAFILRILIVVFFFLHIHSKSFYPVEVFLSWIPGTILFWSLNFKKIRSID